MASPSRPSACCSAPLVGLETGGGTEFFGSPQLDISELIRVAPDGRGIVNVLELPAVQDKPGLFSTVLMWMLAELFETLPEVGDLDQPKLVFFFDEAHLLFKGATPAFVNSVVQTVRLIRSKGVGIFFITQSRVTSPPTCSAAREPGPARAARLHSGGRGGAAEGRQDVPEELVLRRRRTADVGRHRRGGRHDPDGQGHTDARRPQQAARAVVGDGAHGRCRRAREGLALYAKYGTRVDEQSAREMLAARVDAATGAAAAAAGGAAVDTAAPAAAHKGKAGGDVFAGAEGEGSDPAVSGKPAPSPSKHHREAATAASGGAAVIGSFLKSREGRALMRDVGRGIFGMLKK